jgi:nucleoside-diphosphate-sugar epimerase
MNYVITGHTSGIGKALYERLCPNVKGYSLSSGYDIKDKVNRTSIIQRNLDADVFINCAEDGFGQSQLLLELYDEFKDTNKTIINVGSNVTEIDIKDAPRLVDYYTYKKTLKTLAQDLDQLGVLNVRYVTFGYVGTDRMFKKHPEVENYISVDQAVEIILNEIL